MGGAGRLDGDDARRGTMLTFAVWMSRSAKPSAARALRTWV